MIKQIDWIFVFDHIYFNFRYQTIAKNQWLETIIRISFEGMFYDHVSLVAPSKIEVCILTQFEKMHLLYSTSLFFWCYWMFEGSFICHANTLPTILWLHALISKCNWIWNFWKRYKSIFVKDLFRSIDFVSMCLPLLVNCFMVYNDLKLLSKELRKNIVGMTIRFTFFQLYQVLF